MPGPVRSASHRTLGSRPGGLAAGPACGERRGDNAGRSTKDQVTETRRALPGMSDGAERAMIESHIFSSRSLLRAV